MKHWLWVLSLVSALGQTSTVPYCSQCDGSEPTFSSQQFVGVYPGSFSSLQKIDFRNFRYLGFDKSGKPAGGETLRNGHSQHKDQLGFNETNFLSVHYLAKSAARDSDIALVLLSWFAAGGSSSSGESATVFRLSENRLRVVQEINWDTHFGTNQSAHSFDPSTNSLVVRSAHYIPGDAHCCVSAVDVVTYRWDGTHFVQTGIQTELSDYGRTAGKTLPRLTPN